MFQERDGFRAEFTFWQKLHMLAYVEQWLDSDPNSEGRVDSTIGRLYRDDVALLTYYTASKISPSKNDVYYKSPQEIPILLSQIIMTSVFGSQNPDFGVRRKSIVENAMVMARARWQILESDGKSESIRFYASQVVANLDTRLGAQDRLETR